MTMENMTTAELVDRYNALLGSDAKPLTQWKKKKTELISMIEALEADLPSEHADFKRNTIRETSIALLCHVDATDPKDNRTVGLQYNTIVEIVRELFPEGKTSVACLRWYAVKIRAEEKGYEGLTLPQKRPRVSKPRVSEG